MTSVFPLVKRFADVKTSSQTIMLTIECVFHEKCFRAGTIFTINGWREIERKPYLILTKGSWEGLVSYDEIVSKSEKIHDDQ